jgi:hypothetical protein
VYVIYHSPEVDGDEEREQERWYYRIWIPVIVLFIVGSVATHSAPGQQFNPVGNHASVAAGAAFTLVSQFPVVISAIACLVYVLVARNDNAHSKAAAQYTTQMLLFIVALLVGTLPAIPFNVVLLSGGSSEVLFLLVTLQFYLPFANALVWGLSKTCLLRCLGFCCYGSGDGLTTSQSSGNALEMPLLPPGIYGGGSPPPATDITGISNHEHSDGCEDGQIGTRGVNQRSVRKWSGIDLNRLKLKSKIGLGAFGIVYKGSLDGNDIAAKEVNRQAWESGLADKQNGDASCSHVGMHSGSLPMVDESLVSKMAERELLGEARILSKLRHPNIVYLYGVAVQKALAKPHNITHYYFVTELCATSLNKVQMGVGRVRGSELWQMLVQVAAGMQYLHQNGIVHRDLKPANVLVTQTQQQQQQQQEHQHQQGQEQVLHSTADADGAGPRNPYKVCDFGLARILDMAAETGAPRAAMGMGGVVTQWHRNSTMTGGIGTPLVGIHSRHIYVDIF